MAGSSGNITVADLVKDRSVQYLQNSHFQLLYTRLNCESWLKKVKENRNSKEQRAFWLFFHFFSQRESYATS